MQLLVFGGLVHDLSAKLLLLVEISASFSWNLNKVASVGGKLAPPKNSSSALRYGKEPLG
jgi:hypothetical protein